MFLGFHTTSPTLSEETSEDVLVKIHRPAEVVAYGLSADLMAFRFPT